jgi:putative glutamine amidotransferase
MTTPSIGRRRPRIGVSACFMHADPTRALFKGKTLLYAEESMLRWIMSAGAVPLLVPRAAGAVPAADLLEGLDGLVLQGGADVAPAAYGETPSRPEWSGDAIRDAYEIELVRLALDRGLPVLGVCRGAQVLNVALGGSLWQDIATMHPGGRVHRDWEIYDEHGHEVSVEPGSLLGRWYEGRLAGGARVNSVHHQAIKTLAPGLVVEARSLPDGVIEAVRLAPAGDSRGPARAFAYGVQWHPEFMAAGAPGCLDPRVLLDAFLGEVDARRSP